MGLFTCKSSRQARQRAWRPRSATTLSEKEQRTFYFCSFLVTAQVMEVRSCLNLPWRGHQRVQFFEGGEPCEISNAEKEGKSKNQPSIMLPVIWLLFGVILLTDAVSHPKTNITSRIHPSYGIASHEWSFHGSFPSNSHI